MSPKITSISLPKSSIFKLELLKSEAKNQPHLRDKVVLEVAVGAGSVVRSPVDIHGAALVLATLGSLAYHHLVTVGLLAAKAAQ